MADDVLDFSTTTVVNGQSKVNYSTEKTNNNTVLGNMINMVNGILTSQGVPGISGTVGNYDVNLIGDCCFRFVYNGALSSDTGYGVQLSRQIFQNAGLL